MEIIITYIAVGVFSTFAVVMFQDLAAQHKAAKRDQEIIKQLIKEGRY